VALSGFSEQGDFVDLVALLPISGVVAIIRQGEALVPHPRGPRVGFLGQLYRPQRAGGDRGFWPGLAGYATRPL